MDIYKFLWRGRDIEIQYLWQRSLFLGAFLLGITTVYAVCFKDIFVSQFKIDRQFEDGFSQIIVFGIIPIMISMISIIFFVLLIMMAKGSKAWHEVYEDSIAKLSGENYKCFWTDNSIENIYRELDDNEFIFGKLKLKKDTKCDVDLLSTDGGAFSVSKINVMIGIVFFIAFVGLFFFM